MHRNHRITALGALVAGLLLVSSLGGQDRPSEAPGRVVVGTFDSRALTIAFVNSDVFREELSSLRDAVERARDRGDEEEARRLEARGPELQAKLHAQGFGTAPVDDLLERIEGRLPAIATETGVDLLVSKWNVVYRRPGTELVDVTEAMAAAFDPDEEAWKAIREIVKQDPVPLDQLRDDH